MNGSRMRLPAVVRTPSVQNRSLIASGMPVSGANSPRASAASATSARASAPSPVTVMNALSRGLSAAIAARCALVSSRAVNCLARSLSRAAVIVRSVRFIRDLGPQPDPHPSWPDMIRPSLDHLGDVEEVPRPLRRIGQHLLGIAAIGHHVLAHLQRHLSGTGQRLDAVHIHLIELLDPPQNT